MSSSTRLLPRNVIRKLDTKNVSMNYNTFEPYDDCRSIAYVSGVVNYPTRLQNSSYGSTNRTIEIQSLFSNNFNVTASVAKNFNDEAIEFLSVPGTISPYDENRQFEQSSDIFYLTGTQKSIADKFSNKLSSKTQLRFEFPIDTKTTMKDVSGSLMFYNVVSRTFDIIAPQDMRRGMNSVTQFWNEVWVSSTSDGHSFRPFTPAGTPVTSGSIKVSLLNKDSDPNFFLPIELMVDPWPERFSKLMQAAYTRDVFSNNDYVPSTTQCFNLPIEHPFLIEKVVFELPIEAGPGWFNDKTRYATVKQLYMSDFGGPAISCCLMHHVKLASSLTSYRNLIANGVFVHSSDVTSSFDKIYMDSADMSGAKTAMSLNKSGFLQFGQPDAVITTPTDKFFTGSIIVPMTAKISNGMFIDLKGTCALTGSEPYLKEAFCSRTLNLQSQLKCGFEQLSNVSFVNPFQRNNGGMIFPADGRSIIGKNFQSPTASQYSNNSIYNVDNPFFINEDYNLVPSYFKSIFSDAVLLGTFVATALVEKSIESPYLVMPGDDLVIALSKARPAVSSSVVRNGVSVTSTFEYYEHHDVKVNTGSLYMTIYGSYVRDNAEFHDVDNHIEYTTAVYPSVIGNSPVLDQFEVESPFSVWKSFTDGYITGSLVTQQFADSQNSSLVVGQRGVVFDKMTPWDNSLPFYDGLRVSTTFEKSTQYTDAQFFTKHTSQTERIYDTMLPSVDSIMNADNVSTYRYSVIQDIAFLMIDVLPATTVTYTSTISNKDWMYGFPYARQYSDAIRMAQTSNLFTTKHAFNGAGIVVEDPRSYSNLIFIIPEYASGDVTKSELVSWVADPKIDGTGYYGNSTINSVKYFYGFSKSFVRKMMSLNAGSTFVPVGCNSRPGVEGIANINEILISYQPIIHGWKYGIYNGFPTYTSAIWRRGHFGQFRDMLEQRIDTKFCDESRQSSNSAILSSPVTVKFVDKNGAQTLPENTWSSNLSTEATSSLPYFDLETTNRVMPDTTKLNLSILNFKQDIFGNLKV